ncbi:MAG TPA: hypothetical protein VGI85_02100 [Chthoniobacterales bacterium]
MDARLAQKWTVAAEQPIYMLLFAALLAPGRYDLYSIDGWRKGEPMSR